LRTGILACAREPKREVTFGRAGRIVEAFHMVAPALYLKLLPPFFERGTFGAEPRPPSPGNLYDPSEPYARVDGGWEHRRRLPRRLADGDAGRGGARWLETRGGRGIAAPGDEVIAELGALGRVQVAIDP
jgi:hypothetical protein